MKWLIISTILLFSMISLVSALTCSDSFNLNEEANVCGYCNYKSNGSVCSLSTTCYFNIYYSNFTALILNANATNNGDGSFNYSLGTSLGRGTYIGEMVCNDSGTINRDDLIFTVGITTENAPLASASVSGTIYEESEEVKILTACLDVNNHLTNSTANVTVYYPNNTIWIEGNMSEIEIGLFNYTSTAPTTSGVYTIKTICDDGTNYAIGMGEMQIPSWVNTIGEINDTVEDIEDDVNEINSTILSINETVDNTQNIVEDVNDTVNKIEDITIEINTTTHNIYDLMINDINVTLTQILNLSELNYNNLTYISTKVDAISDSVSSLRVYLESKWGNENADKIIDRLKDLSGDVANLKEEWRYLSSDEIRNRLLSIKLISKEALDLIQQDNEKKSKLILWISPIVLGVFIIILAFVLIKKTKKKSGEEEFGEYDEVGEEEYGE